MLTYERLVNANKSFTKLTNDVKSGSDNMIPLSFADIGEELVIKKIGGKPEVKAHLADLGFVVGGVVTVVSSLAGNLIVNVKGSRVAIGEGMAVKIFV